MTAFDTHVADAHRGRARDEDHVGSAPVDGDREVALADHADELGNQDRGDRGSGQRHQPASVVFRLTERVIEPVEDEHRSRAPRAFAHPAAPPGPRRSSAPAARGKSRGVPRAARWSASPMLAAVRCASTTMYANEIGSAARYGGRSSDELAGRDGPTDQRERSPRGARAGELGAQRDGGTTPSRITTRSQRFTAWSPGLGQPRHAGPEARPRARPSRCRLRAGRRPSRGPRLRSPLRSARRAVRSRGSAPRHIRR